MTSTSDSAPTHTVNPGKGFPNNMPGDTNKHQAKTNDIQEICRELSSPQNFDVEAMYNRVSTYKETHQRWFYSDISNYLFTYNKDLGVFYSNLDALYEHANNCVLNSEGEEHQKAEEIAITIDKLRDHSNLAQMQISSFRQSDEDFRDRFEKNIDPYFAKLTEDTNKQLISLIGIFTALSFIVFGGISSLDNIFAKVGAIPVIELVIVGCVWSICILNLVFAFVYLISKLTKLSISVTDGPGATLVQKYPFWVWSNYFTFFILSIFCWIYYIDYSNSGSWLIIFSRQHSILVTIIGSICIAAFFYFLARYLIRIRRK